MEFNFRTTNAGNPPPPPPHYSSDLSYFTEQAIRVGYMRPDLPRPMDYFPSPVPESVLREMEKQKIREEMIAAEMERRHQLEAEVRREMMIEREMAMRSGHPHGFPFCSGPPKMLMDPRLPMLNCPENRFGDSLPFSRNSDIRITEVMATPEVNKERMIILPKPEVNISGTKRKEITPLAANATMAISDPNKKSKGTLRCELCHVSATSEQALKEHFRGKKHKSREARQPTHIAGKNFSIGLFSRKDSTKDENLVLEEKPKEDNLDEEKHDNIAKQKGENSKDVKNDKVAKTKKESLKFAFWCEKCKIGAFSKKVMNAHMKGKKHTSRLLDDLGSKKQDVSELAVEKELIEKKSDIAAENNKIEEIEKSLVDNEEKKDGNVAVNGGSNGVVAPLRIGWIE